MNWVVQITGSESRQQTYRLGANESNSSKNRTQGFAATARANISRTFDTTSQVSSKTENLSAIITYGFLAGSDVLVDELGALDANEVKAAFFRYS